MDFLTFSRVSIITLMVGGLPFAAKAGPLTSVGNVYHVGQITGKSSVVGTEERWTLSGTDIGTMFSDFAGNVFLAFGDSFAHSGGTGGTGSDWRNNLVAQSWDLYPSNGLDLYAMATDTQNHAKTIIPREPGDFTVIPNGGISSGDTLYIHYMRVKQWGDPGKWTSNGSGIAWSDDHGQNWISVDMWGGSSNFVQAAMIRYGNYIWFYGLPTGRFGGVKLARVPEVDILNVAAYRYWTGSSWSANQNAATTIIPGPVGELSVAYNSFLDRYLMMYLNENAGAIQIRAGTSLGAWGSPLTVTTAYDIPLGYGPMLHPYYSDGQDIYFALSAWDPYNVFLMHATLNPTFESWGPFDLPGRVETENFREGGEGVGYHDTTNGNSGNAYRPGDVDVVWNLNEDGHQVGWLADGEWLSYKVNVTASGPYKFRMKYGSTAVSRVQVDAPGGNPVYIPATDLGSTGGYSDMRIWEPNTVFNLNAGQQTINLYFPIGGCDVTWWEVYPAHSGSEYHVNAAGGAFIDPTGKTWSADNYFTGGTASQGGGNIANTLDDTIYNNDRYGQSSYAFPVSDGAYNVKLKFTEMAFNGLGLRRFNVDLEGARLLYEYDIFSRAGGMRIAKDEVFTLFVDDGTLNIDFVNGVADVPSISAIEILPAGPDLYDNHRAPGHIEAEHFATGPAGVAYSDGTSANVGGGYRGTGVDIRPGLGGGYQVGWTDNGEWLAYKVFVPVSGTFKFRLRYASGGSGATVQVDGPGGNPVYVPATAISGTGGWDTFVTWSPSDTFQLNAGEHTIRLNFPAGGIDIDYFELYE